MNTKICAKDLARPAPFWLASEGAGDGGSYFSTYIMHLVGSQAKGAMVCCASARVSFAWEITVCFIKEAASTAFQGPGIYLDPRFGTSLFFSQPPVPHSAARIQKVTCRCMQDWHEAGKGQVPLRPVTISHMLNQMRHKPFSTANSRLRHCVDCC